MYFNGASVYFHNLKLVISMHAFFEILCVREMRDTDRGKVSAASDLRTGFAEQLLQGLLQR